VNAIGYRAGVAAPGAADIQSQATPDYPTVPPRAKPVIQVRAGNISAQVDAAEDALIRADRATLYQRNGEVVRVITAEAVDRGGRVRWIKRAVVLDDLRLTELMDDAATWQRYDARSKEWTDCGCPRDVARHYLARAGDGWDLPVLAGFINAPTIRPDGSILQAHGYDHRTRLYFDPQGVEFPRINGAASEWDAVAAVDVLHELLSEFPFVDDVDGAVAFSAILTALLRPILPAAPLHAFTAPAPGTGKSCLASIPAMIATGRPAPGLAFSDDESENRKQLDGAVLAGDSIISFDNVTAELKGARLCELLTQPENRVRPLGSSALISAPCRAFVLANGNNLTVAADMTRRVLLCRLDRKVERPELHRFQADPLARIEADRGRYVAAALTVLAAYQEAGMPDRPAPLGSFGMWSDWVRGALVWLGFIDPVGSMESVRAGDPRRNEHAAILAGWDAALGGKRVTAAQVIDAAAAVSEFRGALFAVAGLGNTVDPRRLGKWLAANASKITDGRAIEKDGVAAGVARWRLAGGRGPAGGAPSPNLTA
jgi:putative DNA primase/helicase